MRLAFFFVVSVLPVCLLACECLCGRKSSTTGAPDLSAAYPPGQWVSLFDGKTLHGWTVPDESDFAMHGKVHVEEGKIVLETGDSMTGIKWDGPLPREDYEVSLDAMRMDGGDFFCGMTFPVGDSPCTLIIGGWGGSVIGLSNVDDQSAVENETTNSLSFENNSWYHVKLRVTGTRILAWIDDEEVINLERGDHLFSIWWEQEQLKPFGIGSWYTGGALRNIQFRRLDSASTGPK